VAGAGSMRTRLWGGGEFKSGDGLQVGGFVSQLFSEIGREVRSGGEKGLGRASIEPKGNDRGGGLWDWDFSLKPAEKRGGGGKGKVTITAGELNWGQGRRSVAKICPKERREEKNHAG